MSHVAVADLWDEVGTLNGNYHTIKSVLLALSRVNREQGSDVTCVCQGSSCRAEKVHLLLCGTARLTGKFGLPDNPLVTQRLAAISPSFLSSYLFM